MTANMPTIPLMCSICPKKPRFSDVSHLLTHIASKGHLSHYYKVKVRATTEDESHRLLEAYDHWYEKWGVHDMMSNRMNQKDKRRSGAARTQTPLSRPQSVAGGSRVRRDTPTSQGSAVDPRLGDLRMGSPAPHPYFLHYPTGGIPINTGPPTLAPYLPQKQQTRPLATRRQSDNNDDENSDLSYVPRSRESVTTVSASVSTTGLEAFEVSEATRLKGVYWPGMDLFDSATPDMKRKRNQKKDSSVIKQLETNSLVVEPTEFVFTPEGTLKKTRIISGDPDEDSDDDWKSDDSGSQEPARKAASQRRQPLAAIPVNGFQNDARNDVFTDNPGAHSTFGDDRAEWDLAYGTTGKRKRGFEIFQDRNVSFGNPASLNLLNSEFNAGQTGEPSLNGDRLAGPRGKGKSASHNNYFLANFNDDHPSISQENRLHQTTTKSINGAHDTDMVSNKLPLPESTKPSSRTGKAHVDSNTHGFVQARHDTLYQFVPTTNSEFHAFEPFGNQNWLNNAYYQPQQTLDGEFDDERTITAPPSDANGDNNEA